MTNLAKKSILARLLARENITVEHTNHHTAFFDVEKRVLGLPHWKDIGSDLFDLFVGHEVGHALHTPAAGWHESTTQIPGCPRSYVNIVEDIRIEKLVLREFPGLLGCFMRGYQDLLDRDFFGIKNQDINKLSFMNRLNIFAKSRGLVEVKFSKKEQPYVDRAMAVETWDDVLNSCRELYAFMKEELEAAKKAAEAEMEAAIPSKIIVSAKKKGEDETPAAPMPDELKEAIKNGEVEIEVDIDSFMNAEEAEEETEKDEDGIEVNIPTVDAEDNIDVVETDALLRSAIAKSLVDSIATGGHTIYAKGPSKAMAAAVTSSYEDVKKGRLKKVNSPDFPERAYVRFLSDMKDSVAVMVKEFEMKKTARRFARARTSTKGSLDVNALHRYKYDDQLFKQVTHLDDDQSHGMIMLIDYSGSMQGILPRVIKQTLILSTFCKRVGIPFEVYGFTNPTGALPGFYTRVKAVAESLTSVSMSNTHVFKLIDSSMPKKVYEEAFKALFAQTGNHRRYWIGNCESMAGTPLDSAILVMYQHIAAFKAKHNVQKMNFITLTDGQGDGLHISNGIDVRNSGNARYRVIEILGKKIKVQNAYRCTPDLLQGLRDMGVRTMNYHLISPGELKYSITMKDPSELEAAVNQMKKEGYAVFDNSNGYNRQIFTVLGSTSSSSDDEDTDEEEMDASTRDIASKFTNKAFKRKQSRLIAAKFAEVVS